MLIAEADLKWREAAKRWADGNQVWSAELGGIGPGYEQAIQILLWEILAKWDGGDLPITEGDKYPKHYEDHVEKVVSALDKTIGFSGAQVGAAKATAFQFMTYGYKEMMDKLEDDRKILVSKAYPHVSEH